ncbi:hypothetical protein TELCIR_23274, partial [Teladorsagia circumcincta]
PQTMDRPRRNIHTGFSSVLRLSRTPFPSITSYIAISFFISFIAIANIMSVFKSQPEVSINTYFAILALIAKVVIKLTFKELTRQEEVIIRHGFLSFLMFSVVFLSVVAGAHHSHRVLPWLVWFGIIGFLTVLHDITYQRFKF